MQATTFVSFSSVTYTLKLKKHSQLTQSPWALIACYQWLRSTIQEEAKRSQISPDSVRIQGPSTSSSSGLLYPVSPEQNHSRKGRKHTKKGFYSHLFLVPKPNQKWRPVIDLSRLNAFLLVEKFNMEIPESIRTSDSRGLGFVNRPVERLSPYPNSSSLKEVPLVQPQVSTVSVDLSSVQPSHGPPNLYNDCKGGETHGPLQGHQSSPILGPLAHQGPVSGKRTAELLMWIINQEKSEL